MQGRVIRIDQRCALTGQRGQEIEDCLLSRTFLTKDDCYLFMPSYGCIMKRSYSIIILCIDLPSRPASMHIGRLSLADGNSAQSKYLALGGCSQNEKKASLHIEECTCMQFSQVTRLNMIKTRLHCFYRFSPSLRNPAMPSSS